VLMDGATANLAHVGDSRVYLMRGAELSQLTADHSWINEQIQSGLIAADQARTHPLRNVVTRALGGKADCQVEMQAHEMLPGDILLLCSDGLTTMIPDDEIVRLVQRAGGDVSAAAQALVSAANERGGEDNITVLLIRFDP
jgi:PPM family protein phosphatase